MGYWFSQFVALTCNPTFTTLAQDGYSLTVTPLPSFIAKNEHADELISPLMIPALLEEGRPHPLNPLRAFKDYRKSTEGASVDHLFYTGPPGPWHICFAALST